MRFITTKGNGSLVGVEMQTNYNYLDMVKRDLAKIESLTSEEVEILAFNSGLITATPEDCADALDGLKHGRKGLRASFVETLQKKKEDIDGPYARHSSIEGVWVHKETGAFYVKGIVLNEMEIEPPQVSKDPRVKRVEGIVVQLKNMISKKYKFESDKIKIYKLDNLDSIKKGDN